MNQHSDGLFLSITCSKAHILTTGNYFDAYGQQAILPSGPLVSLCPCHQIDNMNIQRNGI